MSIDIILKEKINLNKNLNIFINYIYLANIKFINKYHQSVDHNCNVFLVFLSLYKNIYNKSRVNQQIYRLIRINIFTQDFEFQFNG